ncbi:MAG TPA: hypothetical protein VNC61_15170 [Acidimicrobiales bacterium]|nr:hypothetical protein [Acidimicrobiales bacterium]
MADLSNDIRALIEDGVDAVTFEEVIDRRRHSHRHTRHRRTVARVVSVAVLVAVAVPVVLALSSARPATAGHHGSNRQRVVSALNQTIASGSFDITFSQGPVTDPTSTTTTTCPNSSITGGGSVGPSSTTTLSGHWQTCISERSGPGLAVKGTGTIDTHPFAMVAVSQVSGLGQVTLYHDGTNVWEEGGGDYGQPASAGPSVGSPLSGFAGLVEGTLGPRQGALDMMGLASPTGYLELDQNSITGADRIGSATVDGVPVTVYQVTLHPDQEAAVAGTTTQEASAISSALEVLSQQGYTGTTVKISIDGSGYIRRTESVAAFSDGATATDVTIFSNFGCAGTVLMPGQQGSAVPPAGCVSPDPSPPGTGS